ncbi:hypothetical protein [Streptomyces thioluteus]|uniref:hypothetical protein n=1 Tax=Streptomyces thioluteus TaxID=66431 RepID=UPI0031EEAAFD
MLLTRAVRRLYAPLARVARRLCVPRVPGPGRVRRGVTDPFALLETVGADPAEGRRPRFLVHVRSHCTTTRPAPWRPPEILHEVLRRPRRPPTELTVPRQRRDLAGTAGTTARHRKSSSRPAEMYPDQLRRRPHVSRRAA